MTLCATTFIARPCGKQKVYRLRLCALIKFELLYSANNIALKILDASVLDLLGIVLRDAGDHLLGEFAHEVFINSRQFLGGCRLWGTRRKTILPKAC
jgi:hypothetical protein